MRSWERIRELLDDLLDEVRGSAPASPGVLLAPGLRKHFNFCWRCLRSVDSLVLAESMQPSGEWDWVLVIECHGETLRTDLHLHRHFLDDDFDFSYVQAFDFHRFRYERQAAFWDAVEYSALEPLIL